MADLLAQWSTANFEVILRDGKRQVLEASPLLRIDEKVIRVDKADLDRATVQMICQKECPKKVSSEPMKEDVIVHLDGERTVGHVESVKFDSDRDSFVVQKGQCSDFKDVSYILFAGTKE
ncbi:MAG: hypothetical protein M3N48_15850 [Verrucomicrobiota bacterium]|nr:hypothetical protein [Verrucomicrobiota bacterium]